ncbi:hypothetical protein [Embleya scabrispora]|uniref:hypothetical protein n=1 Tax=Embleya scabrispora TaxID=159449 RepID=UPI00037A2E5A|nr:hypothetical protein [Embleya scabrispora]MYS87728.1 hypothetical protein [Streptomyces sp. SID5474]
MSDEFPEHPAHAIVSGLLDYAVLTNPFPRQAGPPTGESTIARLDMVVSAPPGDPVEYARIEIALPIGTGAQSPVDTADGITPLPPDGWEGAVAVTATTATITFTPPGGSFVFDEDGISASIAGLSDMLVLGYVSKASGGSYQRLPLTVDDRVVGSAADPPHTEDAVFMPSCAGERATPHVAPGSTPAAASSSPSGLGPPGRSSPRKAWTMTTAPARARTAPTAAPDPCAARRS